MTKFPILEQTKVEDVRFAKVVDALSGKVVYRARGAVDNEPIIPMEVEENEFKSFGDWVVFAADNIRLDVYKTKSRLGFFGWIKKLIFG